jgi:serine/threonine protein kinase
MHHLTKSDSKTSTQSSFEDSTHSSSESSSRSPVSSGKVTLAPVWKHALKDYEFIKLVGSGSYGEVVQAKHRNTGKQVAIKLIDNVFKNEYDSKKIVREIQILRQFTQMPNNQFTTKIYDVITSKKIEDLSYIFIVLEFMQTDMKKVF